MAPAASALLSKRYENCTLTEDGYIDESSCFVPFWYTRTGVIVKWSLFVGVIVFIGLYLLLGYLHAQNRIKKGLPPLTYHRFLVSRATLARVDPRYRPPPPAHSYSYTHEQQFYDMNAMPPPPVYDPNAPRPPMYEPPAGAAKVEPDQQGGADRAHQPAGEQAEYAPPAGPPPTSAQSPDTYAPPPGPPPSTVRPQDAGNTNPFRD